MIWTTESLKVLQTLIDSGKNYRQIAKDLGTTASAVESSVRRHDLKGMKSVQSSSVNLDRIDLVGCEEENLEEFKNLIQLKWKIPTTKIPKNEKKPYKIMLVTSDHHVPHHNVPALRAVLKLMDDVKFDINVILGDFYDASVISHWNTNKRKTLEGKRLKKDYIVCNTILDEMDKRLPAGAAKHYLFGNHDGSWFDDLLESMPSLEGMVEPTSQMKLKERGYQTYEYNEIVPFNRLNLTHGIYAGGNPIKKHLDELKVNIMFGHTHQLGMQFSSSPARDIAFAGYNTGCMSDLSPDYMKNRPHAWTHGFAIVYLYPNGYFDVNLIRIIQGKFIYAGKIYDGNI